ncbi:MFS family permease [Catenulispora sp. GP43]
MALDRLTAAHAGPLEGGGSPPVSVPSPSAPSPSVPSLSAAGKRIRFWGTAYTFLILLTGTNLPTPLYKGYEARFGFSPLTLTLIFTAYVAVLIPSLLVVGPAADAVGYRVMLLPALVVAAGGALVFALASSTAWLFAGRILQGVAIGAATGPLTATLTELEPRGDRRKAALVSTVATAGGLGFGPLLAGFLAQYAPAPRVFPFVLEIGLLVPAVVLVLTLPAHSTRTRWRPRRPEIPAALRSEFATSGTACFAAFAVVGLFLTLIPTYVATLSGSKNLFLGGAAVALLLACSATAQVLGYGRSARGLEIAGLPLLALGLVSLAIAGNTSSLALLLAATVFAGLGQGLTFLGGLTAINSAAPADRRADVMSSFFVILYLGVGVPVVGVGFVATRVGLLTAVQYFAWGAAVLCVVVLLVLVRLSARRRPTAR